MARVPPIPWGTPARRAYLWGETVPGESPGIGDRYRDTRGELCEARASTGGMPRERWGRTSGNLHTLLELSTEIGGLSTSGRPHRARTGPYLGTGGRLTGRNRGCGWCEYRGEIHAKVKSTPGVTQLVFLPRIARIYTNKKKKIRANSSNSWRIPIVYPPTA